MPRCIPETALGELWCTKQESSGALHARAASQLLKNYCIYLCLLLFILFQDLVNSKKSIHVLTLQVGLDLLSRATQRTGGE